MTGMVALLQKALVGSPWSSLPSTVVGMSRKWPTADQMQSPFRLLRVMLCEVWGPHLPTVFHTEEKAV